MNIETDNKAGRHFLFFIRRLPDYDMNPNGSTNRFVRSKAKSQDMEESASAFLSKYPKPYPPVSKAVVHVTVYKKKATKMDADNFASQMKGYWDGLVNVGLFSDDNINVIGTPVYLFIIDPALRNKGHVVIDVQEILTSF